MNAYVIAEAGSCHDEEYSKAVDLVWTAKTCDANAVKFQYWSSPSRMRERRRVEDVGAYDKGSISTSWLKSLSHLAHSLSIDFMCTCYLPEDIAIVAPYVDKFKISSFENQDLGFIRAHVKYRKPIIISAGMDGRLGHVHDDADVYWLHCISAYPTPIEQAGLRRLTDGNFDGYSDHTRNVLTGAVAVGAGATILEVHFRLDTTVPTCPDYPVSLTPGELAQYVYNVRLSECLLGDGIKGPQKCERENMKHWVMGDRD